MKAAELRSKDIDALKALCLEWRNELFVLRMRSASDQKIKTHLIPILKKNISKIKTILHEKERALA